MYGKIDRPRGAPRLMREGFGPASPQAKRTDRRNMLIPKARERTAFIPAVSDQRLSWLAGELGPVERRALREICETGELVKENGHTYVLARVSSETIDALAAFESEGEDREPDLEDEPGTDKEPSVGFDEAERDDSDQEEEPDQEHDFPREREALIQARQLPEPTSFDQGSRCPVRDRRCRLRHRRPRD